MTGDEARKENLLGDETNCLVKDGTGSMIKKGKKSGKTFDKVATLD